MIPEHNNIPPNLHWCNDATESFLDWIVLTLFGPVLKTNGLPVTPGNQKLNWTSKFDLGQVKIITDYISREIFSTFLKTLVWNTVWPVDT